MASDFEELFGGLFNTPSGARGGPEAKPLPQVRARRIDGVLYVRAVDVADALAASAPATNRRLIARLREWAGR